ncbi:Zinc-type Alcohol Dehydrogenase-like protein [Abortiporus biennis]
MTTQEYYLPQAAGIKSIAFRESLVRPPKPHEVLVKIHAVSLNYRDIIVANGQYPGQKPEVVPCSDMAGEVIFIGEDIKKWKIGDRVCANFSPDHIDGEPTVESLDSSLGGQQDGVLTQYKNLPAHSLVLIPEKLSYEEAATLPCAALTAWNAFQGPRPLKGGDTVLVQGTGGVSIFGLQLANAMGADVIVTSSSNEKLDFAKRLGAKHLVNYKQTPDWDVEVKKITNGRGVDHIIEVGGPGTLVKSVKSARLGGWIHNIGFVGGPAGDLSGLTREMLFNNLTLRSVLIGSRRQFEDMLRLIETHDIKPVVNSVFAFTEVKQAYEHLLSQKHIGKVVIRVQN